MPNPAIVLAVQGPLARSAVDLELAFDVVAGPDLGEDAAWRLEVPPARHDRLSDYRVAVMPSIGWLPVDSDIESATTSLAEDLRRIGCSVSEVQPAAFGDLRAYTELYYQLLNVMVTVGMTEAQRRCIARKARAGGSEFGEATAQGLEASASDFMGMCARREVLRQAYRAFFQDWDLLLAPITIVPAFPHTTEPMSERTVDVNGRAVVAHNLARWTARIGLGERTVITKTLRRRVFALVGRITRSARRLTLHLPRRWPWETQFSRALARLQAIPFPA